MILMPYQSLAANTRLLPLARPHGQGHFSSVFAFSCKGSEVSTHEFIRFCDGICRHIHADKNKLNTPPNRQWMYIFNTARTSTKDPSTHMYESTQTYSHEGTGQNSKGHIREPNRESRSMEIKAICL